ncbi:MAG: response regulator, partial [bacterium]|nr:response regulator [bacterium]
SSEQGSVFTVRLPLADEPCPPPEPRVVNESRYDLNVVIVEDNDDAREMLEILLQNYGCDVASAASGKEGVNLIADRRPDVAVLDIGLPDIDGYHVAAKVREEQTVPIHLIALTGYGQPDDIRRSEAAGFNEHLVKPIKMDQLLKSLSATAERLNRQVSPR